ncbi:MAG: beta-lactamase family protein [Phycisphaeraceae bacterium]|nr:beta-lactamase family protein [Phycisphaeraceae bacterium]MCW5753751.1 beta-lactamase family protein [Phycisphaeraceae bacterium]
MSRGWIALRLWLVCIFVATPSIPAWGVSGKSDPKKHAEARLIADAAMEHLRVQGRMPGLQAAVAVGGEVVWAYFADAAELHDPQDTPTSYRIASISKSLTGMVLAMLAAEGVLSLDAPIGELCDELPEHVRAITPRQLASHTSGIRHYRGSESRLNHRFVDLNSALAIFVNDPLVHTPGARYTYSTYGYTLLGVVMERAAGMPFHELLNSRLFIPLGLTSTDVEGPNARTARLVPAFSYDRRGNPVRAAPTDHTYKIPGGGMVSTARDLVRFGAVLAAPGGRYAEALRLMTEIVPLTEGGRTSYGLGIQVGRRPSGSVRLGHSGSQPGATSRLLIDVDRHAAAAMLANIDRAPFNDHEVGFLIDVFTGRHLDNLPEVPADIFDFTGGWRLVLSGAQNPPVELHLNADKATLHIDDEVIPLTIVLNAGGRLAAIGFSDRLVAVDLGTSGEQVHGHASIRGHGPVSVSRLHAPQAIESPEALQASPPIGRD